MRPLLSFDSARHDEDGVAVAIERLLAAGDLAPA